MTRSSVLENEVDDPACRMAEMMLLPPEGDIKVIAEPKKEIPRSATAIIVHYRKRSLFVEGDETRKKRRKILRLY